MARREGGNREHKQPFDDERELRIGVEGQRTKRQARNAQREAARRRRQGNAEPEPSVPSRDATPDATDVAPTIIPAAVPEAGHDIPVGVPHGDTAVPEGEQTGEADVPAGVGESTAGSETAAAASASSTGQESHAEETDAQREKRENQEACSHFQKGKAVRISIRDALRSGWQVEDVYPEHGVVRVVSHNGLTRKNVMAKLLLAWQPGDFTQQGAGAADIPPSAPEGADDARDLAATREALAKEFPDGKEVRVMPVGGSQAEEGWRVAGITEDGRVRVIKLGLSGKEESDQAIMPDDLRAWQNVDTGDSHDDENDDTEAERRKQQYRSALEDLGEFYNSLLAMSEEEFTGFTAQFDQDYGDQNTGLAYTENDQILDVIEKAQETRAGNRTGLEALSAELDDADIVQEFINGDRDIDEFDQNLDAQYAGKLNDTTRPEYERLKGIIANIRAEIAQREKDNAVRRFYVGQEVKARYRTMVQDGWEVVAINEDTGEITLEKDIQDPSGTHREQLAVQAIDLLAVQNEDVTPEPPESKEVLDQQVDETRAAYAKALRTKVHAFIGVKKDEEVNRLHDEYVQAMDARLQHTIDMVKRGFEGKDLANPDVQKKLGDRLIVVTQAGRLREETAFRRDLRETEANKASRKIQQFLAKHAKARLWTGLAMTVSAIALGLMHRGELAAAINAARTPLGVAGSVTMTDAAWQLIESSHGAMKKRTQAEIDAMNDPDEIRKILAAHEWKYARFMTHEFGNRSEFHLPKFDRTAKLKIRRHETTYDETGRLLMARYDQLMREKIEQDIRAQLQQTGGNIDQAVADRAKHYAVRQEELGSLRERGKKERRLAIGKIFANTIAGIASALTINRIGHKPVPPPGQPETPSVPTGVPDTSHVNTGAVHDTTAAAGHAPVPDSSATHGVPTATFPDTSAAGHAPVPDASVHAAGAPVPEAPGHAELYVGRGADAAIRAKEGIEHPLRRQLEHFAVAQQHGYTGPDNHDALHAWSAGEAHRIALHHSITDPATGVEHPIIDPKTGMEQWVHTPGTEVTLHADGSVTVDHPSDLYTHAAYHPDAGHAVAHVPQPESSVPAAAAPGSVLPLDTTPHEVLQQTIHDAYYPSDAGAPTDEILIGPDTYVPDALHHVPSGIEHPPASDSLQHSAVPQSDVRGLHGIGADSSQHAANADIAHAGIVGAAAGDLMLNAAAREMLLRPRQKRYNQTIEAVGRLKQVNAKQATAILHAIGAMRMRDIANEASIVAAVGTKGTEEAQQAIRDVSAALWTLLHKTGREAYKPEDTVAAVVKRTTNKSKHMDLGAELG